VGKAKAGETLVVSAAGGAVGSLVGQIAKLKGLRVVGIAGSDGKCRWITEELGFDAAINYKREDLGAALKRHCPGGIDIDFENVGGPILDTVLQHMKLHGRVVLCGLISAYNATEPPPGPRAFGLVLLRRLRIQGFIVPDYLPRVGEALAEIGPWLAAGKIKYRVDQVEGLRQAPSALNRLFRGDNTGKLLVRVSDEP
jgi:NADPH-dependent curcumin reductase